MAAAREVTGASLRLHRFLPHSRANGPGTRAAIWTQGCSLGCPGCFNPETHPFTGGEVMAVETLAERIAALGDTIEGISVLGGEPLQQRPAITRLLQQVRGKTALGIILFTGYTWEEVTAMDEAPALLESVDAVLAGRYDRRCHLGSGLRGSSNKTVRLLTARYALAELDAAPPAEILIRPDGTVVLSGIDPLHW